MFDLGFQNSKVNKNDTLDVGTDAKESCVPLVGTRATLIENDCDNYMKVKCAIQTDHELVLHRYKQIK